MQLSQDQIAQLKGGISACIQQLYDKDAILIRNGGMERTIASHFARYLYEVTKEIAWLNALNFDVEYGKNGLAPKRTPRRPNGAVPDLIVHKRGSNDANILVIEIKGWWNKESRDIDQIKLEDFTHQEGEYKYGLGAFLDLGIDNCEPQYFLTY